MTEMWQLPIFPTEHVAVSLTVTVWVGVCVVVFFNLRFGWTLSGLVVPGYLVPLLLLKPNSAAVVLAEAVATYALAWLLSERCRYLAGWSSFFGRDRFFLIVVISVLVRAVADGWLLPMVGKWMNNQYGLAVDYRNDLHSYGLIVVALIANYFWKPGIVRGSGTLAVTLAVSCLLVRFGLIGWTNFTLGGLHYIYDDMATSLLASPKAYILVLTSAYIASRMNLRYAWDFSGILIPALLALLWHEPAKVFVSIGEGLWVLALATLVLKLPLWRTVNVEGGRKLLLFFTLCAVHRVVLGHLVPRLDLPLLAVTDTFGFGYLLTTLIAVKAHDKGIPVRMARGVLHVSMMGAVAGSLIGFALSLAPADWFTPPVRATGGANYVDVLISRETLPRILAKDKIRLYWQALPGSYAAPTGGELRSFAEGVERLLDDRIAREVRLEQAAIKLARVGYQVYLLENRYAYLRESAFTAGDGSLPRGWGIYVVDLQGETNRSRDKVGSQSVSDQADTNGPVLEVPLPLEEPGTLEAAAVLMRRMSARALAIGGTMRLTNRDGSSDQLRQRGTLLARFHETVDAHDVVQLRARPAAPTPRIAPGSPVTADESLLWVRRSLPRGLDLAAIKWATSRFRVRWGNAPGTNRLRDLSPRGFAELWLDERSRWRMQAEFAGIDVRTRAEDRTRSAYLHQWLVDDKTHIARAFSNSYQPPLESTDRFFSPELRLLDREVLTPLIHLSHRHDRWGDLQDRDWAQLDGIRAAASTLHYEVTALHDEADGNDYFVLCEQRPKRRHWGTYLLRLGMPGDAIVEVPRPLFERNAYEFGGALFQRSGASALLLAGAHPHANADGSADVIDAHHRVNAFRLVQQVLLREQWLRPMLVVQARAIQAPVQADVLVAVDDGSTDPSLLSPLAQNLLGHLRQDGMRIRLVDGAPDTAGYEVGLSLQAASLNHVTNKQLISLWISPVVRRAYRVADEEDLLSAQFSSNGIETADVDLADDLVDSSYRASSTPLPEELFEAVSDYVATQDIVRLWLIKHRWPNYWWRRIRDVGSGQTFLVGGPDVNVVQVVVNLSVVYESERPESVSRVDRATIRRFIRLRQFVLEITRPQREQTL